MASVGVVGAGARDLAPTAATIANLAGGGGRPRSRGLLYRDMVETPPAAMRAGAVHVSVGYGSQPDAVQRWRLLYLVLQMVFIVSETPSPAPAHACASSGNPPACMTRIVLTASHWTPSPLTHTLL